MWQHDQLHHQRELTKLTEDLKMTELTQLSSLAKRINLEHTQCEEKLTKALYHAYQCGVLLTEAKQKVSHGKWSQWLKENCTVSQRMAQKYMKIASSYSLETLPASVSIRKAVAALSESKTKRVSQNQEQIHRERLGKILDKSINFYPKIKGIDFALSQLIPFMTRAEYTSLWQDIRRNGLHNPIVLNNEGILMDGRMRLMACFETGVPARFELFTPSDTIQFALSCNVHRKSYSDQEIKQIKAE